MAGTRPARHAWASPPGNLYASLLLDRPCDAADRRRSSASSPALRCTRRSSACTAAGDAAPRPEMAERRAPRRRQDRRASCSKAETLAATGALAVVIGFGVNVAAAPDRDCPIRRPASQACGPISTPDDVFAALAELRTTYAAWREPLGRAGDGAFSAIRDAMARARRPGSAQEVAVRLPTARPARDLRRRIDGAGRLAARKAPTGLRADRCRRTSISRHARRIQPAHARHAGIDIMAIFPGRTRLRAARRPRRDRHERRALRLRAAEGRANGSWSIAAWASAARSTCRAST